MGMDLGLLLSAVSGAGQGAVANLTEQQKQQDAIDLEQAKSDADIARQKAAIDYNIQKVNEQRTNASAAINQNYQGLLQSKQLANWNSDANLDVGDGSAPRPATPDDVKSGAVDLTDPEAQLSQRDDTMARLQAEAQYTNDYSKLATLQNSSDIAQNKWDTLQAISDSKNDTRQYVADQQNETRKLQIQLMQQMKDINGPTKANAELLKAGLASTDDRIKIASNALKEDPSNTKAQIELADALVDNKSYHAKTQSLLGIDIPNAPTPVTPKKPFNPADFVTQ